MRKNAETLRTTDYADVTDGSWQASDTDTLKLDGRRLARPTILF